MVRCRGNHSRPLESAACSRDTVRLSARKRGPEGTEFAPIRRLLTVNGPVKYAIEKRKLYVIDEDGKEHEMEIVKKTLRTPEPPKP